MNPIDSMLAGATASVTAAVAVSTDTGNINPIITQIVVPLIAAVLVPYLKDLAAIHVKALKDRLARRKKANNDKHPPAAPMVLA